MLKSNENFRGIGHSMHSKELACLWAKAPREETALPHQAKTHGFSYGLVVRLCELFLKLALFSPMH